MQTKQPKSGKPKGSSAWLQTLVLTGSLAATVVGAGMINRLETIKSSTADEGNIEVGADPLVLEPIPTLLVPPASGEVAINLPTTTPVPTAQGNQSAIVIPTDTPEPTWTPAPTATPIVVQQSTQSQPTVRVRRRTRSSR